MSTSTPTDRRAQTDTALALANTIRLGRARLTREVRAGQLSLRLALDDPAAQSARAARFTSQALYSRGYATTAEARIGEVIVAMGAAEAVTVASLSPARRDQLCATLAVTTGLRRTGARIT
jgi:hypothetical protein